MRDIGAALARFKAAGKPVVAWGLGATTSSSTTLRRMPTKSCSIPSGVVYADGYGRLRNYFRDALDKLGIKVNILRVGKYKSFGEPFFLNGPSDAAKDAETYLYTAVWSVYTEGVEKARKLPARKA